MNHTVLLNLLPIRTEISPWKTIVVAAQAQRNLSHLLKNLGALNETIWQALCWKAANISAHNGYCKPRQWLQVAQPGSYQPAQTQPPKKEFLLKTELAGTLNSRIKPATEKESQNQAWKISHSKLLQSKAGNKVFLPSTLTEMANKPGVHFTCTQSA